MSREVFTEVDAAAAGFSDREVGPGLAGRRHSLTEGPEAACAPLPAVVENFPPPPTPAPISQPNTQGEPGIQI
jgi:hypothetical protein